MTTNEAFELVEARIEALIDREVQWYEGSVLSALDEGLLKRATVIVLLGYGDDEDFIDTGNLSRVASHLVMRVRPIVTLAPQVQRTQIRMINDITDALIEGLGPPFDGSVAWYKESTPTLLQATVGQVTSIYDEGSGLYSGRNIPLRVSFQRAT